MVSYSRLRPAMSRAEPMRWCVVAAGGGGGCGRRRLRRRARARGFGSGRAHGVSLWTKGPCRHGQGGAAFEGGVSSTTLPRCLASFFFDGPAPGPSPLFGGLSVEAVHGGGEAV